MKKPKKDTPACPYCNAHPTIRKGYRKSKQRTTKKYQCKNPECRKYFTPQPHLQTNKTYPINIILNTISNLNLGYSLRQTSSYFKGKRHSQKKKNPKIHNKLLVQPIKTNAPLPQNKKQNKTKLHPYQYNKKEKIHTPQTAIPLPIPQTKNRPFPETIPDLKALP